MVGELFLDYTLEFSILAILASVFTAVKLPLRSLIMANGKIKLFFSSYGMLTFSVLLLAYFLLTNHYPIIVMMYLLLAHSILFCNYVSLFVVERSLFSDFFTYQRYIDVGYNTYCGICCLYND